MINITKIQLRAFIGMLIGILGSYLTPEMLILFFAGLIYLIVNTHKYVTNKQLESLK